MALRQRTFWQQLLRPAVGFIKFRLLHVEDSPQRIAKGVAVGLWVAFSPLMGLHMLIALILAALFRANKAIAVALVWLSNPFTVLPVYGPCYLVGSFLAGRIDSQSSMTTSQVAEMFGHVFSIGNIVTGFCTAEYWNELITAFIMVGMEMMLGWLVLGTILAIVGYIAATRLIIRYRATKGRRRFRQHV